MEKEKLIEISDEEVKNYKRLGSACAESFSLCLYEGSRHCENFMERVVAYRILENNEIARTMSEVLHKEFIAVEFFEKLD